MWSSGNYIQRQHLQNAFFEGGMVYNRQKDECRTIETNEFLSEVSDLSKAFSSLSPSKLKNFKPTSLSSG